MAEARFTVHDTPQIAARIQRDLHHVVATVRQADPHLRSLVLTGGFARGEGSVLRGEPQNDYDFVAIRTPLAPRRGYRDVARQLEADLGLHVDLSPVAAWRLRWVAPAIFWYETALRGRVLYGEDLLGRIRVRRAQDIDRNEALRLLVNRAAGLLLAAPEAGALNRLIPASKALLAAADAHLFALGEFAPSQAERWQLLRVAMARGHGITPLQPILPILEWAFRFKVEPETAPRHDPDEAWQIAARALLDAVPVALGRARLKSLEAYARRDGILDHLVYLRRANQVPGARRLLMHPTGRVRVATLRLLEASLDGRVRSDDVRRCFEPIAPRPSEPARLLESLRKATLQ